MQSTYARVYIRDLGPFEHARVEVKPLTILIGRNSVGKSMLMQLLWALTITVPDLEKLGEQASSLGASRIAERILELARRKDEVNSHFRKLVELHVEALPASIAHSLGETLREVFASRLSEVVREGSEKATIGIETPSALIEFMIQDDEIVVSNHKPYTKFLDKIKAVATQPGRLKVIYANRIVYDGRPVSISDLAEAVLRVLALYIADAYKLFSAEWISTLLPDSRAGVSRILLKPYTSTRLLRDVSYIDEHYRDTYFMLIETLSEGGVDTDMLRPLLNELGCNIQVAWESGAYTLYIDTWSGKRLTIPRAPSGIREALTVALALASRSIPRYVFIEEPEAHLHPRAQRALVRLITQAINKYGKTVVISTHSDYILYTINNLVILSATAKTRPEPGKTETLSPENVAAYLFKADTKNKRAMVEELNVTNEGVPEEEFAKVAEELAEERARILA